MAAQHLEGRNTKQFWDGVSQIYSEKDMTKHDNDSELDFVLERTVDVVELVCLGVADGCRDPVAILDHMLKQGVVLPTKLVCNDISPKLLEVCENRLTKYPIVPYKQFFPVPISELNFDTQKMGTRIIIGTYNANYIMESLGIYNDNNDVIGTIFDLSYLTFDAETGELKKSDEKLTFHIKNYMNHKDTIMSWCNIPNFYAYSVETDNDFVSHYFDLANLAKMYKHVFGIETVNSVTQEGDRYIVADIGSKTPQRIVTMLNNVQGNIQWYEQTTSLEKIAKLFS
jgi:hypothetical protein